MPATAGRVRMPANNRVHSSAALQTHGIWQSAIGYDPYAPNKNESKGSAQPTVPSAEPDGENAYNSFQGLLALARITGSNADEARGACKRCGRVGHLSYQCRNFLSLKEDKEKDLESFPSDVASELSKLKAQLGKGKGGNLRENDESEDEDEDTESSDSDYDSEMERIIAARTGKKVGMKEKSKKKNALSDSDGSLADSGEKKKKRGRSKKRSSGKRKYSDDSDEGRKKRSKEKRRKRDESSDEDGERRRGNRKSRKEKRRRRSHRHSESESDSSEDSRRHRSRRSEKAATPSDDDASRVGRGRKRSVKKSEKRHHGDE